MTILDINQIRAILPHRYPFLLVDRIIEMEADRIVGITLSKKTETVQRPPSQKVMLRIPTGDVDRARRQAADKGIGYQTYIKMILRAGLDRVEKVRRRA